MPSLFTSSFAVVAVHSPAAPPAAPPVQLAARMRTVTMLRYCSVVLPFCYVAFPSLATLPPSVRMWAVVGFAGVMKVCGQCFTLTP